MKKLVCIIMTTYNGEKFLEDQLDSITTQSYKNWILYVSDDGSSDKTLQILRKYQRKLGKDKLIIRKNSAKRHGAKYNFCDAINTAPEADYYFFSDQDDVWDKDKVKILVSENSRLGEGPVLTYCNAKIVDENLKPISSETLVDKFTPIPSSDRLARSLFVCRVAGCTMCLNRELLELSKNVDPEQIHMHDFYILLLALSLGKVKFIDKTLNSYRQHPEQVMGTRQEKSGIFKKFTKLFNKELHKEWRIDNLRHYSQAEQILEKDFSPEFYKSREILEKFIKISKYKSKIHKILSFYIYKYRTKDWWTIIEKGF